MLAISILTTSCNHSNIAKVKPESTSVSGDLSEYLQVVDNNYEIVDDWGGKLSIRIRALRPYQEDKNVKLLASILNDEGMPVSGSGQFEIDLQSREKLNALLKRGTGEEIIQLNAMLGGYKADQHAGKAKEFSVTSVTEDKVVASAETSNTDESASSGDFDALLDEYEKYTDNYIKMIESMNSDDMGSAIHSYADALENAQSLEEKLKNAQDNLSPKQASRMLKIQAKMVKAMQRMGATRQ